MSIGVPDDCIESEKTRRKVFTGCSLFVGMLAPLWGLLYIAYDETGPGMIPIGYSIVTLASLIALSRSPSRWRWFRISQLALMFVLPIVLMLSLGGFVPGSAVMMWAVFSPVGAIWGGRGREATAWVVAFMAATVICGIVDPLLRDSNNLPDAVITWFFVLNIVAVMGIVVGLLSFYVRERDELTSVLIRNRELESAYLAQELSVRQSDKLATIGKLSAGMAHELNNPAAAAQRATQQLAGVLFSDAQLDVERSALDLTGDEVVALDGQLDNLAARVEQPEFLDPLERSDREQAVGELLESRKISHPWDLAAPLVSLGLGVPELEALAARIRPDRLEAVLTFLALRYNRQSLIAGLDESMDRIIGLVGALKTYTYLDTAPRQPIDIHEGLESTLVMLHHRLKSGIEVERSYADNVPEIEAHGSELNQVWTNIVDNAIDAMGGEGVIAISTSVDGDHVSVEIADDGPGVPDEVIDHIFDPFVTSKPQGRGTGLGLNIVHNIVTQKHGGSISVSSSDAGATFRVELPLVMPRPTPDGADAAGAVADAVPETAGS